SILLYVTAANVALVTLVMAAAAALPWAMRRVPRSWMSVAAVCTLPVVLVGPMASRRVDTRGMDRNVVAALIGSGLPRVSARAGAAGWRQSPFQTARNAEDLSRFAGSARGLNIVMVSLESTAAQYLALYGGKSDV